MQKLVSNWLLQINSFSVIQIGDDRCLFKSFICFLWYIYLMFIVI